MKSLLFTLLLLVQSMAWGQAEKRIALVIGNAEYQVLKRLSNPHNDAYAIANKLRGLGFKMLESNGRLGTAPVLDLNEDNFIRIIKKFSQQAQGAEIAMIYYAGHGMQFAGGGSYLLPVDVPKDDIDLLQRHAVSLESVLKALDNKAQLTVAVFDACREIPQIEALVAASTRSTGLGANQYRGMGRVQSRGRSRVVAFSGAAGQLVKDGTGRNSPYTRELLNQLDVPGQEVGDIFRQVAYRFGQQHGGQQPEVLIQGVPPQHYYFTVKPWQSPVEDKLPLTIKTSPANARVRILNIEPKYQDNIELKSGRYHIEVSLSGYKRHTEWLTLDAENKVHSVVLTAIPEAAVVRYQPVANIPSATTATKKRNVQQNGIDMIWVDPGCFQMGSNRWGCDEKPVHRVCLSNGYYLGKYEVTQAQWQSVMGSNPSYFKC